MLGGLSTPPSEELHVDYQPQVDLLFAWVGEPQKARNIEVEPGVYVRVSETKRVVGIEILDCSVRFERTPDSIDRAFAESKLKEYGPLALANA